MKNSNDTIRNRTRDLPGCSAVPQLTAALRATMVCEIHTSLNQFSSGRLNFMRWRLILVGSRYGVFVRVSLLARRIF